MKILLTMNLPYLRSSGGANRSNRSLAEALAARGHRLRVLVPALPSPARESYEQFLLKLRAQSIACEERDEYVQFTVAGVEVIAVQHPPRLRAMLVSQLRSFAPDRILVSSEDPTQNLLAAALEHDSKRVVYLAHTPQMLPFGPHSLYPGAARTELFKQTAGIVALSHFMSQYIQEWTGRSVFLNHPPHFGTGPFPRCGSFDAPYVLMMNPCAVKGISIFLELARSSPHLAFAAVPGYGTTVEDREVIERLPNITLLQNAESLDDIFRQTRLLLMPSLWPEGFGMAAVDAMLRGIPVLASDLGGLLEAKLGTEFSFRVRAIEKFDATLDEALLPRAVVPPQDVTPWRECLEQLAGDRAFYEKHASTARDVSSRFVSSLNIAPLEAFLQRLPASTELPTPTKAERVSGTVVPAETSTPDSFEARIKRLSPEQRALFMLRMNRKLQERSGRDAIVRVDRNQTIPLSFAQQRLWFIHELQPESAAYNMAFGITLQGKLDRPALRRTVNELVRRHEILRTTFPVQEGVPVQRIAAQLEVQIAEVDLRVLPEAQRSDRVRELAQRETEHPFLLEAGPLLRVKLLQTREDDHVLLVTLSHIVADGWSIEIILREFGALYEAYVRGMNPLLPEPRLQYADFAVWQRDWIEKGACTQHLEYWRKKLQGVRTLELAGTRNRIQTASRRACVVECKLDAELLEHLKDLAKRENATLYMILLAALDVVLFFHSGQRDVAVGTITANRSRAEMESLIGFFVNTLILRTQVNGDPTFREFLADVRNVVLEAYQHQDLPFEMIVEALAQPRQRDRMPMTDVMLVLQNIKPARWELNGLQVGVLDLDSEFAKFDLMLVLQETESGLEGALSYASELYQRDDMERLVNHFKKALELMTTSPDSRIGGISLLTPEEERQLLVEWKGSEANQPHTTVVALFEEQANLSPLSRAVECGDDSLTYSELNRRANQVAHWLKDKGIGPESRVAICVPRSLNMIIGLLGILKAGAAYVPVDAAYPAERIEYLLTDSGAKALVSQGDLTAFAGENRVNLDLSQHFEEIAMQSSSNPVNVSCPDNLAYMIYTSGSTGMPKGVAVENRGVVRLVKNQTYVELDDQQVFLQFAPLVFDASTFEIWGSLLNGGRLVVHPPGMPTLRALGELIQRHGVTVLWLTAGLFHQMVAQELESLKGVRQLLTGGDVLQPDRVRKALSQLPHTYIINGYGPTENTTFSCCHRMSEMELVPVEDSVPIGIPITATQAYVLDQYLQPVPVGAPGELCLGGAGLARGYEAHADLTAERFVPDPFARNKGQRLYRTGDRVRWRRDGLLEFLGRFDRQVKVSGYRIEPAEVEAVLRQHPEVQAAAVTAVSDGTGDKNLAAYIIARDGGVCPQSSELRRFLLTQLPPYMVPQIYTTLDAFPLTSIGKVDYRRLAQMSSLKNAATSTPPRDNTEALLKTIWTAVLGAREFGVTDDFFTVGGTSLKATVLCAQLSNAFGRTLPLSFIFDKATIGEQAVFLRGQSQLSLPAAVIPIRKAGSKPPLFCVHPYFGLAHCYVELSRLLGADQPFYGLQSRGLEPGETPLASIPEMASFYIAAMRQILPAGPYQLAGWSMGALIAYEMAQQLANIGEEVSFLGLLEGWAPSPVRSSGLNDRIEWEDRVREEEQNYLAEGVVMNPGVDSEKCRLSADGQAALCMQRAKAEGQVPDELSLDQFRRLLRVIAVNKVAIARYDPLPYSRTAVLLRTPLSSGVDDAHGWGRLVSGGLQVFEIEGTHDAFMSQPVVGRVAEILLKCLSPVGADSTPAGSCVETTLIS